MITQVQQITFIYGLYCPTTEELRYVGKTCNPTARLRTHRKTPHLALRGWIGELADKGLVPLLGVIDQCYGDGSDLERRWITDSFAAGHDLLNRHGAPQRKADWLPLGRPATGRDPKRTFRCSDEMWAEWERAAAMDSVSVSEFIRVAVSRAAIRRMSRTELKGKK